MLKKMGRRRLHIKISNTFIILIIAILIVTSIVYIIETNLKPTITAIAESKINLAANEIINRTVYEEILKDVSYHDLISTHKDSDNKVTLIQANSIEISRLMSLANLKIKEALDELCEKEIAVPLGQALGSYLFATYGPNIKIKILPVGELKVNIEQDFHESGINQTRHILYINVLTAIKVVIPMTAEKIIVSTKIPVAETIIVGPVPNTMVRFNGLDNLRQMAR